MKYDVFISYSSKDQKVAEGICGFLESNGIRCFVAFRDIPPSKVWASEVVKGLDASSIMVIVYSQNFNCSEQVDREIELAAEDHKPMLTYRLSDTQFEGAKKYYLKNINWIDAFPEPEKFFGKLLENIQKLLPQDDYMNLVAKKESRTIVLSEQGNGNLNNDEQEYQYTTIIKDARKAMSQYKLEDVLDLLLSPSLEGSNEAQLMMVSIVNTYEDLYNVPNYYFDEVKEAACSGNSFAQFIMANYYRVKEVNHSKMFQYAQMSANRGDVNGMYTLSRCYELGLGVEKNEIKSKELLRKSISKGSPCALLYQARNYLYALTVKRDIEKGIKLLQQCMSMHIPESFDVMGKLYSEGKYIEKNTEKAEKLFCQAVREGYPQAYSDLGMLYAQLSTDEPPSDINQQKGMKIIQRGAELGIPSCLGSLAIFYDNISEDSVATPINEDKALQWYKRAAERGHKPSMARLGYKYYHSYDKDTEVAWELFKKSECLYMLGKMCMNGHGGDDKKECDCISFFKESASRGGFEGANSARTLYEIYRDKRMEDSELFRIIKRHGWNENVLTSMQRSSELDCPWIAKDNEKGMIYIKRAAEIDCNDEDILRYGLLLTEIDSPFFNEIEGTKYLRKASERGLSIADVRLGDLYNEGFIVPDDVIKVKRCYQKAAEAGLPIGKARYGILLANEILDFNKDVQIGNEESSIYKLAFNMLSSAYHFGETSVIDSIYILAKEKNAYVAAVYEAQQILIHAAQRQHINGLINCGMMYQYGTLWMQIDKGKALKYYKQAVCYGSAAAPHHIVQLLYTENTNDATSDELASTFYWGCNSDDKKDKPLLYKLNRIGKDIVRQCEKGKRNKEDAIKWVFPWMCDDWIAQDDWRHSLEGLQWAEYCDNQKPNDYEKDIIYFPTELCSFIKNIEELKKKLAETDIDTKLGNLLPQFEAKDCFPLLPSHIMEQTARACYDIWLYVLNEELSKYMDESELHTLMDANSCKMLKRNKIKDEGIYTLLCHIINIKLVLEKIAGCYRCYLYNLPILLGNIYDCDIQIDYLRKVADVFYTGNVYIPRCYQLAAKLYAHDPDCQLSYERLKHCKEVIDK